MSTIVVAGDSWGIGVYSNASGTYGPTGQGIETLLKSLGHTVINISKGGGSNGLLVDRLYHRWDNHDRCLFGVDKKDQVDFDLALVDYVIFIQTDAFRERHYYVAETPTSTDTKWKKLEDTFVDSLLTYNSLDNMFDSYFNGIYNELDLLGVPIFCIGGWSMLHPCIVDYKNLIAAVPSATQLLIPELQHDTYISDPEWFSQLATHQKFMTKFGTEFKQITVAASTKLDLIYCNWHEVHPNLTGYQTILDAVLAKQKVLFP